MKVDYQGEYKKQLQSNILLVRDQITYIFLYFLVYINPFIPSTLFINTSTSS